MHAWMPPGGLSAEHSVRDISDPASPFLFANAGFRLGGLSLPPNGDLEGLLAQRERKGEDCRRGVLLLDGMHGSGRGFLPSALRIFQDFRAVLIGGLYKGSRDFN